MLPGSRRGGTGRARPVAHAVTYNVVVELGVFADSRDWPSRGVPEHDRNPGIEGGTMSAIRKASGIANENAEMPMTAGRQSARTAANCCSRPSVQNVFQLRMSDSRRGRTAGLRR